MHKTLRAAALAAVLLLAACGGGDERVVVPVPAADSDSSTTQRVNAWFEHYNDGKQPGVAVLAISGADILFKEGYGYADIANDVRVNDDSLFRLASVSKQFTAAAILKLYQEGELDLDDPIVDYLPYMDAYPGVTIRHLLVHTTGIPDYYDEIEPRGELYTNEEIARYVGEMAAPVSEPGTSYDYSNSSYELLPLIIEEVTGDTFPEYMRDEIFAPAGMETARIIEPGEMEFPGKVVPYECADGTANPAARHHLDGIPGSGGMFASLNDMYRWDQAFRNNTVLTAESKALMLTEAMTDSGEPLAYGLGIGVDEYKGHKRHDHSGGWIGTSTYMATFPGQDLSLYILTNCGTYDPGTYVQQLSDLYLPGEPDAFKSAAMFEQVRRQHERLPTDDIWWTANGEDMAWNFKNLHQLMPTVNVYRGGDISKLVSNPNDEIANAIIETPQGEMTLDEFIHSDQSTVLGVIVMHNGEVAYERYPRMEDYEMPVYWSVAKSFAGTVVRILEEQGKINVDAPIDYYIPEISESDLAGISVRDILDMANGLDCSDGDYYDKTSCYYRYSMGVGDGFPDENAPEDAYEYLKTLKAEKVAEPGEVYSYSGVNTFVLGWLVEKVTGLPFHDVLSREIWYHIGAESNASYIAPVKGIPVTHGGFMARLRDVARLGLLFTPSAGVVTDREIISEEHVDLLLNGGRPELLQNAGMPPTDQSGIRHNVYQWDLVFVNGDIFKGGWAGQGLVVNPLRDTVIVYTGYFNADNSQVEFGPIIRDVVDRVTSE